MQEPDLFFVIPTYRLREVGETVEQWMRIAQVAPLNESAHSKSYGGMERVVSYLK